MCREVELGRVDFDLNQHDFQTVASVEEDVIVAEEKSLAEEQLGAVKTVLNLIEPKKKAVVYSVLNSNSIEEAVDVLLDEGYVMTKIEVAEIYKQTIEEVQGSVTIKGGIII